MAAIVAIPARIKSTRFPGKVLADIHGMPMLWHVYRAVSTAQTIDEVWVLTDSKEVLDLAVSWGAKAMMTSEECPSGTARIASVIEHLPAELIINVQADEPLLPGAVVDEIVAGLQETDAEVATPVYSIKGKGELENPNIVKVVRAFDKKALYFSRSPVPYVRDSDIAEWASLTPFWGHVGVYGFKRKVLEEYEQYPMGKLEEAEKLEQLRLLEAGKQILTVETDYHPRAVDVPSDLEAVKAIMGAASHS